MPIKTTLFLFAFVFACGGALFVPLIGVIGYVMHYQIGPENQWWGQAISHWGLRFSFILGGLAGISTIIHRKRLQYGEKVMLKQEWLVVLFLALVWVSYVINPTGKLTYLGGDDIPALKISKIILFGLILTHVMSTVKRMNILFWAFVVGAAFLGYQAYTAGPAAFASGTRLNKIGGPDFREANGLALYLAGCIPIIAVQFMRSGWIGKVACLIAGPLAVNGIVLTQSRGAVVGLTVGVIVALVKVPKRHRRIVLVGLAVVAVGGFALTNPEFWDRTATITAEEGQRDASAQGRIEYWRGSLGMLRDHPLGVGPGRFRGMVGPYLAGDNRIKPDAHSTYVLCYSELGIQGFIVYIMLVIGAWRILTRVQKGAARLTGGRGGELVWVSYALLVSLSIYLATSLTGSKLYSESLWWFLLMPVCLIRALENLRADSLQMRRASSTKRSDGNAVIKKRKRVGVMPLRKRDANSKAGDADL
jgi:O-antigen ligase